MKYAISLFSVSQSSFTFSMKTIHDLAPSCLHGSITYETKLGICDLDFFANGFPPNLNLPHANVYFS